MQLQKVKVLFKKIFGLKNYLLFFDLEVKTAVRIETHELAHKAGSLRARQRQILSAF